jgi:hypothetical protein
VDLLQGAAPYIELHQSSTMVIHIASEILDREAEKFQPLMDDIATLHILGASPGALPDGDPRRTAI